MSLSYRGSCNDSRFCPSFCPLSQLKTGIGVNILPEGAKIKAHCGLIASTPGAEYNCISTELINIKLSGGMPDFEWDSKSERARIKEQL